MAWVESHKTIRNDKNLKTLCDELKINRREAIGLLHCFWWWALDNREDGDLSGLFDCDIADACDWSGDPLKLIKALKKHGWITDSEKIKNWENIGLGSVKRRQAACNERSKYRARLRNAVVSKVDRHIIILRDNSTCYICFAHLKPNEVTLDHVKPLARGGSHTEDNLRVACRPCNSRKWAH